MHHRGTSKRHGEISSLFAFRLFALRNRPANVISEDNAIQEQRIFSSASRASVVNILTSPCNPAPRSACRTSPGNPARGRGSPAVPSGRCGRPCRPAGRSRRRSRCRAPCSSVARTLASSTPSGTCGVFRFQMRYCGGHEHLEAHRFDALDELEVRLAMALPAVLQAFLLDQRQAFVQRVEHGRRGGVMITMRDDTGSRR